MSNNFFNKVDSFKILITRQEKFAQELTAKITAFGGSCLNLPLFAIESTLTAAKIRHIEQALPTAALAICVSRNAAELVVSLLKPVAELRLAAVGLATAQYLEQELAVPVIAPRRPPYDSEALVQHLFSSGFTLAKRVVLLFNGEAGGPWLAAELQKRGALVETFAVYARVPPRIDPSHVRQVFNPATALDVILITCVTSLENLLNVAGQLSLEVLQIPLLVVSVRIYQRAIEMGFVTVYTAKSMAEADILSALLFLRSIKSKSTN